MIRKSLLFITIGLMPGIAMALGLGKLDLDSGLNQPFQARVEILSVSADELSTLKVGLADIEAFRRAGISRPFILSQLRFEVVETEEGSDYIHIYSQEPIREPYLNFLVEANWSRGRLFREYTVLLDPPLYDPGMGSRIPDTVARPAAEPYVQPAESRREPAPVTPSFVGGFTGDEYGPVGNGETLWSIASRIRPDESVSTQQMMLALLQANPEAFINNNINGLKRGQILRMPDSGQMQSLGQAEAVREVRSQNSMWEDMRSTIVGATPQRPVSAEAGAPSPDISADEEEAELRLVAAEGAGEGQTGAETEGLDRDLALATEQLEVISQENTELRSRLSEAESVIDDLKRLIELKDDELAALQQQIAEPESAEIFEETEGEMEEGVISGEEPVLDLEPEEEVTPPEQAVSTPAVVSEPVVQAPVGIVGRVQQIIMDNLMIIAGAVIGVVVVIILLVFISRRRSSAAEEGIPLPETGFSEAMDEDEIATEYDARHAEGAVAEIGEEEAEEITDLPEAAEEETPAEEEESEAPTEFAAPEEETPVQEQHAVVEFEEEALAEVNVFLAYEHFDQAEEFVRSAIEGDPENLDYHLKLLEVFYAAGNKAGYEEEARVLHDLVNGQGNHWDMTTAMWQEMSPNRALFAEPVAGEEAPPEEEAGGMLDLTSGAEQKAPADKRDAGLDFDFGSEEAAASGTDEGILDISAPSPEEDILDVTAAVSSPADEEDQDLLDVTAAVGIDVEPDEEAIESQSGEEEVLDLTASSDEEVLDLTAGSEYENEALEFTTGDELESSSGEDLLDVSKVSGEDLLDVTSHTEFEEQDIEEDLLDVTSSTSAGVDSDELLEISEDESEVKDSEEGGLDLDISDFSGEIEAKSEQQDENIIDFETVSESPEDEGLALDFDQEESISIEESSGAEDAGGLEIDFSTDEEESKSEEMELSLYDSAESGAEIDLTVDESEGLDESLESTMEMPDLEKGGDAGIELELDTGEEEQSTMDMESTVQMPKIDFDMEIDAEDEDEDEDEDEHTVFVPRSSDTQEQSSDDEITTKLDLAKAYVELGDKESAKGILEEIIADGNTEQRQQAEELLKQV